MKKEKYVISILLTSFIFLIGLLLGSSISSSKLEDVQRRLQLDFLDTQSLELELIIAGDNESVCNYIQYRLPEIVKRKTELGRKFDITELDEGQREILYKQYIISLGRYWLFSNIQEKQCGIKNPTVLFFFDHKETSREQGKVLDYLVFRSNEALGILAFSTQANESLINLISKKYNITETPAIVIDNKKFEGFQSTEKVSGTLCEIYPTLAFC